MRRSVRGSVRRLARPLPAALLAVAVLAGLGWVVLASPVLGVRTVDVEGTDTVPAREVLTRADVDPGQPLARVDSTAVAARVAAIPRVAAVEVHRRWPHTLAVVVQERVPVAAVALAEGFSVVDADGVELFRRPQAPDTLPVLTVAGRNPDRSRQAALAVLTALPAPLAEEVEALTATTPDDVSFELADGSDVVWGSADRSARKALVLAALQGQEADRYDVSAPDAPTTR